MGIFGMPGGQGMEKRPQSKNLKQIDDCHEGQGYS